VRTDRQPRQKVASRTFVEALPGGLVAVSPGL